ncbi:MAG: hypothetical protein ACRYHQ_03250 [Janthinobacterium lividum]
MTGFAALYMTEASTRLFAAPHGAGWAGRCIRDTQNRLAGYGAGLSPTP